MKALLQRVSEASVTVSGKVTGKIGRGLLVLAGFTHSDTAECLPPVAEKLVNLRIFPDDAGRFDKSLIDISGELLLVPQFTLYAGVRKGRRPDFSKALVPEKASVLFDQFVQEFQKLGFPGVQTGVFGADMQVALLNSGPVTIEIDSEVLLSTKRA